MTYDPDDGWLYAGMAVIAACLWTAAMIYFLHQGLAGFDSAFAAAIATLVLFVPVWALLCIVWHSIGLVFDIAGMLRDELRPARRHRRRRKA